MYSKNNLLFIIYKAILVIICGYGLAQHMGPGKWSDFNYYTILSNAVCFIYFLASLIINIKRLARNIHVITWKPRLEGAVVFCITVTFLIYHFVLRPEDFRTGNTANFYSPLNMVQHYIVPVMVILDWIIFCPKKRWRRYDPVAWLLIPMAYFIYILIRAPFAGNIGDTSSPYPYSFIDIQEHGVGTVAGNALWALFGVLALAYLIYFIDLGLAKLGKKMKEEKQNA